jgi:hypothetical protein
VRERVRQGMEERDDVTVGEDVRDRRAVFEGDKVNVPVVQDNEQILISCRGLHRKPAGEVRGRPFRSVQGKGVARVGRVGQYTTRGEGHGLG